MSDKKQPPGSLPKRNAFVFNLPKNAVQTKPSNMPSRLPLLKAGDGTFSLGLRLGFDEPPLPSSAKKSFERAKLVDQLLIGKTPSGWEQVDKGELAKAIWGIFSESIAPDFAKRLTSGLSTPTGAGKVSYELDLVLITDFSKDAGGGVQFTVRW